MPAWERIFSKKGEHSTSREKKPGEDEAIPRFMEGTRKGCPEEAKAGRVIRFLYDPNETSGSCFWMEGTIEKRVTKESQSKRTGFSENWFNISRLKILAAFGESNAPIPEGVRINLAPKMEWFFVESFEQEDILSNGEDTEFQVDSRWIAQTSEVQEEEVEEDETGADKNEQRKVIVPTEIDSEVTDTIRSSGKANNQDQEPLEDDRVSTTSVSTVKSTSSTRLARVEQVGAVMENELVKKVLEKMGNLYERATTIEKKMLKEDLATIRTYLNVLRGDTTWRLEWES